MALSTLLKSFRFGGSRAGRGPGLKKAPRSRPAVEALEARELLCFSVTDLGAQSLGELHGMNAWGQVAGTRDGRAVLYSDGTFYDLGTLPGHTDVQGRALNNYGQVVGTSLGFREISAWIYSDGTMTRIPALGRQATPRGINDAGQVVGTSTIGPSSLTHAFLYEAGVTRDLGTLPGGPNSRGVAINSWGQVVGDSTHIAGAGWHAFLYSDGVMTDLGTLPGSTDSRAVAINDAGQVAGNSGARAFLYSDGVMTDLGTLPGSSTSVAVGMNEAGQVFGISGTRAFLYSDGVMTDLGTLPGHTDSSASDISNYGEIVGAATYMVGQETVSRAFSYTNGFMYDLNDFIPPDSGWVLERAIEVNDSSQILGLGKLNGVAHYFKLDWQCWGNGPGPASDDGARGLDTSLVAALPASSAGFSLDVTQVQPRDAEPRSDFSEQAWTRALAEDDLPSTQTSRSEAKMDAQVIDLAYAELGQASWLTDGMPG